jgi:CHAD domain-containing protein
LAACHAEPNVQQLPPLRKLLVAPLRRLHKKIRQDAAQFDALDDEARHRLRRRIKRLRYAGELIGSLWPGKVVSKYLRHLQNAQTPLGELMDATVALEIYRNLAQQEPRAWFAVGWLSARREALSIPCEESLQKVAASPRFWSRN